MINNEFIRLVCLSSRPNKKINCKNKQLKFQLTIVCPIRAKTATLNSQSAKLMFGSLSTKKKPERMKAGMFSKSFRWARRTRSTSSSFLISTFSRPRTSSGFSTAYGSTRHGQLNFCDTSDTVKLFVSTHAFTEALHSSEHSHRKQLDEQHSRPCDEASKDFILESQRIYYGHFSRIYSALNFHNNTNNSA